MSAEREREGVRLERGPTRCPYCHESIAIEEDVWRACAQCLGRHHAPCWSESGACASCGHGAALSEEQAERVAIDRRTPTDLGPVPSDDDEVRARQDAARAFDQSARGEHWWASLILTPLTLGLYLLIKGERELRAHRRANAAEAEPVPEGLSPELRARFLEARARTSEPSSSNLRLGVPLALLVVGLVSFAIAALSEATVQLPVRADLPFEASSAEVRAAEEAWDAAYRAYWDRRDLNLLGMFGSYYVWVLAFFAYLHAFREGVRRHETAQLFVKLVGRAVPGQPVRKALERFRGDWNRRRVTDTVLSAMGLIPFVGALFVVAGAPRIFGALDEHLAHEEFAEELARAEGAAVGKAAPPPDGLDAS